jgi:hypothetical protein
MVPRLFWPLTVWRGAVRADGGGWNKRREEEPKPAHNIEQLRVMTCARGLTFATFKGQ